MVRVRPHTLAGTRLSLFCVGLLPSEALRRYYSNEVKICHKHTSQLAPSVVSNPLTVSTKLIFIPRKLSLMRPEGGCCLANVMVELITLKY